MNHSQTPNNVSVSDSSMPPVLFVVGTAGAGTALCTTRPTRLIFRVSTHAAEQHARGGDGSIRLGLGPGVRVYTSAGLGSSNDSPLIRIGSVRTDFGCQNAIVSPSAS